MYVIVLFCIRYIHHYSLLNLSIITFQLYRRLKHEVPKFYLKISVVDGDCSLPGLGLSNNNINTLINEVNIIFHGAATVRFNEHIRVAMNINVSGTREVIKLARKMTNLKVNITYNGEPKLYFFNLSVSFFVEFFINYCSYFSQL